MKHAILKIIILYQKTLSPVLSRIKPLGGCRFYPSCSEYNYRVIEKYGLVRGLIKGLKRIIRCHPFDKGGYDPC